MNRNLFIPIENMIKLELELLIHKRNVTYLRNI